MSDIKIILKRFNGTDWDILCLDPSTIKIEDSNGNSYSIEDNIHGLIKTNGESTPQLLGAGTDFNNVGTGIFVVKINSGDSILHAPSGYNSSDRESILISCFSSNNYYKYQILHDKKTNLILYRYCTLGQTMIDGSWVDSPVWGIWERINSFKQSIPFSTFFTTNPFGNNINTSTSSVLLTNLNQINFYIDFNALSSNSVSGKIQYMGNVPEAYEYLNFAPKIECCFPILSKTAPYLPIGSVWIYPNGNITIYGGTSGGYVYGNYIAQDPMELSGVISNN